MFRSCVAAIALVLAVMTGGAASAAESLVLMTWGGVWQKTFQELAATYKAETGNEVAVLSQASADAGLARLIAQKDKVEVDLWTPNMVNYIRAVEAGVLAPGEWASLKNAADVPKELQFSHAITAWVSQRGIFYRKDLAPFALTKWQDLWDERLKGKIAAPAATFDPGYFPLMAAVINGGSEKNLDPGFQSLQKLKGSVATFFTSNVQSIRLLEAGEVAVVAWGVLPNVIKHLGPDSKYGFVIPKPAFVAETPIAVVAGTPKKKAALDFINFILSPKSQAVLSAALGSVPANAKVAIPDAIKPIASDVVGHHVVNYDAMTSDLKKIMDRYDREIMAR